MSPESFRVQRCQMKIQVQGQSEMCKLSYWNQHYDDINYSNFVQKEILSELDCLETLSRSRDRFFDVSVSDPTVSVSVSVSRSFLDFLETVSKRKSCLFGNCLEAKVSKVLVQNCIFFGTSYSIAL